MKVLVTGGTGFVGSHLVEALRRRGDRVTALVRSPERAAALFAPDVRTIQGDLDNESALREAAAGQDVVFHSAALVAALDEAEFYRVNREGTARLLQAAAGAGVERFVLVSTLAAAGPATAGAPRAGDEPPAPVSAYGRSKLAAEEVVRTGPLPWTILRPPTVYGPRDREVLKIFQLARTGLVPVFGRGDQRLSAIYAPDLVLAFLAAVGAPPGRIYYPAHPDQTTSGELARAIGRVMERRVLLLPVPEPLGRGILGITGAAARLAGRRTLLTADKANEFFQTAWTCDPASLTRDTGWRAAYDLEGGLRETLAWYRAAGWL